MNFSNLSKSRLKTGKYLNQEAMHPFLAESNISNFVKDLYRIKGFANLRNIQDLAMMQEQPLENLNAIDGQKSQMIVLDAAKNFNKALGRKDCRAVQHLANIFKRA